MQETWVLSLGWEDLLEKGTATHSSVLAWRILWYSPWGHKESDTTERLSLHFTILKNGLPRWHSWKKNLPVNAGDIRDAVSIPGSGKSPGEGDGNPLQYSCLEVPKSSWGHKRVGHNLVTRKQQHVL